MKIVMKNWNRSVLTVGNVDPGGDAWPREGEDVERGEVGQEELVLLELLGPRQAREQLLGAVDQGLKKFRVLQTRNVKFAKGGKRRKDKAYSEKNGSILTWNFLDWSLLTMATNPSNSPLIPMGSLQKKETR